MTQDRGGRKLELYKCSACTHERSDQHVWVSPLSLLSTKKLYILVLFSVLFYSTANGRGFQNRMSGTLLANAVRLASRAKSDHLLVQEPIRLIFGQDNFPRAPDL